MTLKTYREQLGFEIGVPPDWEREASTDGALSDVTWEAEQTDPEVGPLTVQVRRDAAVAGAAAYLADEERVKRNRAEYERIALSGDDASAGLEYTYRAGTAHFHVRTRAIAADEVYTLTFSLHAGNAPRLRDAWQASHALLTEITDSFRLTS